MLECVVNVSEGRDRAVLDELSAACGRSLLDLHADTDHHRSVFTLVGPVESAVGALVGAAFARLDLRDHRGVHPRLGVVDVIPYVALDGEVGMAVAAARRTARRLATEFGVPTFLYDRADPAGRSLPEVRRDAFVSRPPDHGPPRPHPRFGAVAVGARDPLVALNCVVAPAGDNDLDQDLQVARIVAAVVRERDGGLPGVRALGLELPSQRRAQVSMNLVDLAVTGMEAACLAVEAALAAHGRGIESIELVGLVSRSELARCSPEFLTWSGLDASRTIEARMAARRTPGA